MSTKAKEGVRERTYPDTEDGAREYLAAESTLPAEEIREAEAEAGEAAGEWTLRHERWAAGVYLAHLRAFPPRERNDFEVAWAEAGRES